VLGSSWRASCPGHERAVAEPILLQFQQVLGLESSQTPDEQEFLMAMYKSWEDARAEGRADALLTVLRARGIAVPDAARDRILAQRDQEQLKRWLEKAIVATSIGDVIDGQS
jgi:hypothetical protein